jgi:hypothetical protein
MPPSNPTLQRPRINGRRYSFSSLEAGIDGRSFGGFASIDYSHGLDPGEVRAEKPQVEGVTVGEYSAEASYEMYLEEHNAFLAYLGPGYMTKFFGITCSYAEKGEATITDRLPRCRIKKVSKPFSQGKDPLKVKVDLWVSYVNENGLTAIEPDRMVL